jgi:glycosyltransferase involved in cell wall biosynthesis
MPYRILMLAPTSFFGDYGCHVRILEETLALQKLGHRIRIVTYPLGRDVPGLDIRRTMPLPWHADYEVGSSHHKFALDALLAVRAIRTAVEFRPHLIHAHLHDGALIGAAAAALLRVPLIFDFQGSLTGEMVDHHFLNPKGPFYRPWRAIEHLIDRLPGVILTSSQNGLRVLTEEFRVPPHQIVPIPDAVDPERFHPAAPNTIKYLAELREYLGIPRQRRVVIYLGLLADYQGTRVLLDAAEKLVRRGVDVHFVVLGFPGIQVYADHARKLGIMHRVSFPGKVPYDDAPTWLALGDVALAPKMSATEGNGKILNYMATGLPVVAFDNPVSREYLGEDGAYAPSGDVGGLAAAIETLLSDLPHAREVGRRLRARAQEKFAWDHSARKIEQAYQAALAAKGAWAPVPTRDASQQAARKSPPAE